MYVANGRFACLFIVVINVMRSDMYVCEYCHAAWVCIFHDITH